MSIDLSKIRPGDTVRVRYQDAAMKDLGVAPVDVEGAAYSDETWGLCVGPIPLDGDNAYSILEYTPARPDWADALVVRAERCSLANPHLVLDPSDGMFADSVGGVWDWSSLEREYGPITVVLDKDGNPPTAEVEWLDADALDELPEESLILGKHPFDWPRWKDDKGGWVQTGVPYGRSLPSGVVAPARLLWKPES